jgi:hypothetical protein
VLDFDTELFPYYVSTGSVSGISLKTKRTFGLSSYFRLRRCEYTSLKKKKNGTFSYTNFSLSFFFFFFLTESKPNL